MQSKGQKIPQASEIAVSGSFGTKLLIFRVRIGLKSGENGPKIRVAWQVLKTPALVGRAAIRGH